MALVGGYRTYNFLSEKIARVVKKKYHEFGLRKKPDKQGALRHLFKSDPRLYSTMDFGIMSEEYYWENSGRTVIFPEDEIVLQKLLKGKFDLTKGATIDFPHDTFLLSFPKSFEIAGYPAEGAMVTWVPHPNRPDFLFRPFLRYLGAPDLPIHHDPKHRGYENGRSLMVCYETSNFESNLRAAVKSNAGVDAPGMARAAIPEELIPQLLQCRDGKDYAEMLGKFHQSRIMMEYDLDEQDNEYQYEMFRILAGMAVYTSASDDALKEGYPSKNRPRFLEPKGMKRFNDFTLGTRTRSGDAEKASHVRSFHFRNLRAERFYQGEHKDKPQGSRWVFVSESYVGKDVDAQTLQDTEKGSSK